MSSKVLEKHIVRKIEKVEVSIRLPEELINFLEAYSQKFGVPKVGILKWKILEKAQEMLKKNRLRLVDVEMSVEELSEGLKEGDPKAKGKGKDKITVFLEKPLHRFVEGIAGAMCLKPSEVYKMLIAEFYHENRDKVSKEDVPYRREEILKTLSERFGF